MTLALFAKSAPSAGARFSPCRTWRYELWRRWSADARSVAIFCGLNPSTADELMDDPTIRRDIAFAKRLGHGRMVKVNLFGYRSTEPLGLLSITDPVGPENDAAILGAAKDVRATFIACWGSHRKSKALTQLVRARAEAVTRQLTRHGIGTFCFGTNDDGMPKHTLYLPSSAPLTVLP